MERVSVPTKGTHLLYDERETMWRNGCKSFPSPRRGPIFSTIRQNGKGECSSTSFRPHEGDPSSLRRKSLHRVLQFKVSVPTKGTHLLYSAQATISICTQSFRPHEGDPSSLRLVKKAYACTLWVSVPTKGTHLLYLFFDSPKAKNLFVSVPTKGTHLLYLRSSYDGMVEKYSFRPHEGDPSSLRGCESYNKRFSQFPSPRRGPIFSTLVVAVFHMAYHNVSVPTKGTHLLYQKMRKKTRTALSFRPHEGDPSSLPRLGYTRIFA